MEYYGRAEVQPQTRLRPIVKPGTSRSATVLWAPTEAPAVVTAGFFAWIGLVVVGVVLSITNAAAGIALIVAALVAGVGLGGLSLRGAKGRVVGGVNGWQLDGQRIHGEAFAYLEDIDGRFAFTERLIKEIPTGIDWADVADDVAALRWEAAEHAAKVSAIDDELRDFHYAAAGTPQAALKKALEKRRAEHKDVLIDLRWEADSLARVAGNALAAAKVALAATGDVGRLDAVTPSREALVASANLAGAKARMKLLTEVWAELDPSGTLLAEQLQLEPPVPKPTHGAGE